MSFPHYEFYLLKKKERVYFMWIILLEDNDFARLVLWLLPILISKSKFGDNITMIGQIFKVETFV